MTDTERPDTLAETPDKRKPDNSKKPKSGHRARRAPPFRRRGDEGEPIALSPDEALSLGKPFENPYEEGFLLILIIMALVGLFWLFAPFLPGLFLALLLATSTYPFYRKLKKRFDLLSDVAAFIMTVLVFLMVVTPVVYLLVSTGLRVGNAVHDLQTWLGQQDPAALKQVVGAKLATLPIPEELHDVLINEISHRKGEIGGGAAKAVMAFFRSIGSNSLAFISSLVLTAFALFFFYRDGPAIVYRIKVLTPLENQYDDIFMDRFAALSTVLTLSTLGIALLQGLSFTLVTFFLDLPWAYLGVAMAVASFIPVVGGFIVWGPLAYHLYWSGHPGTALLIAIWGAVVVGFMIDNLLRPVLIRWLSNLQPDAGGDLDALNHTMLTVLATFGGMVSFGILGLMFGPMIAAMAITVFDIYEIKHGHLLDRS